MQKIKEGPEIAEEIQRRTASLRDDDAPRCWNPY